MTSDLIKQAKILIIDDEEPSVQLLARLLNTGGYANVSGTTDATRALSMFADDDPDLILLDLHMPEPDGFEILTRLREMQTRDTFLPIIVLTADTTLDARRHALALGATDFLSKPLDEVEVAMRIRNVLQTRFTHRQLQNEKAQLEERVKERTRVLERTIAELKCANWPLFSGQP
jgi:putative two-component system response regulator